MRNVEFMNYGRAVRIARAAKLLSQGELAALSGLAPSYISRIESGERQPRHDAIQALADALQVPTRLLELLAASSEDLRGIDEDEAASIGRLLLGLLDDRNEESHEGCP
jgi:transcriptional regulator with XRE-family HTH domain